MKSQQENKLYSYKMTHVSGFAPNPYYDILTLATCKPILRLRAKVGIWIAGWTSKNMKSCSNECDFIETKTYSTEIGQEKLIYLAKVIDKITYAEYWEKYPQKRPKDNESSIGYFGDNIYKPTSLGYVQIKNGNHKKDQKEHDLKGLYVLICEEFYYFGIEQSLEIPVKLRPEVPERQHPMGYVTNDATDFINFVRENADKCFRSNQPIKK